MLNEKIRISPRFCGPPKSGNGGYVCGMLAKHIEGIAEVTLRKPPPLSRELSIEQQEDKILLLDGELLIASARLGTLDDKVPQPPTFEEAVNASRSYAGFKDHHFPTCFVCGPEREEGDGLCIFAGKLKEDSGVAAPWIPDASLADSEGVVKPEFIWSALDCPGAFAISDRPNPVVLGRMTAKLVHLVKVGQKCIVIGWPKGVDGRKQYSGTAVFLEDGTLCAYAHAIWIELVG